MQKEEFWKQKTKEDNLDQVLTQNKAIFGPRFDSTAYIYMCVQIDRHRHLLPTSRLKRFLVPLLRFSAELGRVMATLPPLAPNGSSTALMQNDAQQPGPIVSYFMRLCVCCRRPPVIDSGLSGGGRREGTQNTKDYELVSSTEEGVTRAAPVTLVRPASGLGVEGSKEDQAGLVAATSTILCVMTISLIYGIVLLIAAINNPEKSTCQWDLSGVLLWKGILVIISAILEMIVAIVLPDAGLACESEKGGRGGEEEG